MTDVKLLKEKILDSGITYTALARKTGLSRETIHKKLNNPKNEFTASQIVAFTNALRLTADERDEIFLR